MIAHVDNRITYNGNGNATEFAYQFKILDRTDIKVLLTGADGKEKLLTKDYYVDVEKNVVRYPGYAVGAEVPESERPPVLPTGWKLTIYREVPVTQETDLPDQYPFNQVEDIGDKLTMIAQQLTDVTGRSLKIGVSTSADIDTTIPWENGKSFRISDDGKTLELSEDPAKVLPLAQGVYAQTQAQAQIASASAAAAAKSEDSAFESAGVAGNSAQYASLSAASAAENAELTSGYKQEALTAKADATASATNAKASEANAKISENNAEASKEAAQSAATTASNFANASRSSANEARTYRDNAKTYRDNAELYMNNAKNYSENVNVFVPSVSSAGVLSWTNKAGLPNPASVNIKGVKGDAGTAATITIGSVTTGEPGTNVVVSNSGTSTNAILNFTIPRGQPGSGGGTSVEVDAALSDTSLNPVQNKVIKAALDNKVNKTDTIYEANLGWGGRNIADNYSPIDAAMVPFLGANRFAFAHAGGITVEYSTDAGKTWLDYGLSNNEKIGLLLSPQKQINIGKAPDNPLTPASMLRVTLNTEKIGLYTNLNKFIMRIATNGCKNCYCTIDASLKSTPEIFKVFADKARLSGWSGWNVINTQNITTYSNAPNIQYNTIRFTFGCTEVNTNFKGLGVYCIFGFGGVGWSTPSNMAQNGHLYNYNALQEATFPANVSAPAFIGNLTGTADKAKSDGEGNVITETYAKKDTANTWEAPQTFKKAVCKEVTIAKEIYGVSYTDGGAITLATNVVHHVANSEVTLDMAQAITDFLSVAATSTVFSIYITTFDDSAAYPLIITNAGTLKYVGSASDFAITGAGLLLNILMVKDSSGNVTSIVQASNLS